MNCDVSFVGGLKKIQPVEIFLLIASAAFCWLNLMKRRGCPILGLLCFVSWQWPQGHQLHLQFADFTAIPICHSPTASLNRLARTELEDAGLSVQATPGRWYLRGEAHGTEALAALAAMAEVRHVRSIRRIVLCYDTASASVTEAEATNKKLAQMLDAAADWDLALQDLKYLSAKPVSSCCVVCKRPKQTALLGFDASELRQELAKCLERRLGWSATGRGSFLAQFLRRTGTYII